MKDEITEKLSKIQETISNPEEANVVMKTIAEILGMFTDKLVEVSERQLKLEEKVEDIFDAISEIEEEMIENMEDEFEAECPYCGETIPFYIPEEGEEFECPHCGNIIEMELLFDDKECGCGGCHGHHGEHGHCSHCQDDIDEDEESSEDGQN